MKYKKMFLILIMICIFVSLSSVYASENITLTTNQLTLHDENDELSINEVNIDNNDDLNKMKNLSENENYDEFEEINLNQNDILSQDNDNELSASLTKTQISISDSTITLSETSIYKPTLTVEVKTTSGNLVNTGKVYFEIYKNSYNKITTSEIGVHDGVAYYQYDLNLNPGKYRSVAHYLDSSKKYESSSYEFYLIIKTKTVLSVNDIQCDYGEYITIESNLKCAVGNDATKYGNVIFIVNSKKYTTNGSLSLTMKTPGTIKCTAQYIGTSYYLNSTKKTFYITVNNTTDIMYSLESTNLLAGEKINVDYKVVIGSNNIVNSGIVKITQPTPLLMVTTYYNNLPSYSTSGHVSITAPNKPGQYEYGIYYSGKNTAFKNSRKFFKVNIYSISKISSNVIKTHVGKTANIKITVKDHLGQNINEGIIKSTINGKTYRANVNNGKAIFNNVKMPLKANTYHYTVTYSTASGLYTNSKCTIKIICSQESKIKVKSITGYAGKKVKLTATVKDGLGNKIKKGTIKFKINGKIYKAKVKNGKATKKIKLPKAKVSDKVIKTSGSTCTVKTYYKTKYSCTALFSGYKQYPKSSSNFKITSKKKPITKKYIVKTSSKKKSSSKSKSKNVNADIFLRQDYYTFWFNYNGHTLGNMPVTYKIYTGSTYKEYQSQTNNLGFVDIYPIPKGTHKIFVKGKYLLDTKSYKSTFTVHRV